ncbi:MAG: hypothetical protein Q8N65_03400 [bacterium]|nr:hypothetical protein [bacterium]
MREEDLIKKLERIELPEVELLGHKHKLRLFLMSRYSVEQKRGEVFAFLRPVLAGGFAFAILLAAILNASFFSQPSLALAKEIALRSPEVRALIEEGGIIQDIQIVQGRARLLLIKPVTRSSRGVAKTEKIERPADSLPAENQQFFSKPSKEAVTFTTFSVDVDFKENKVTSVRKVNYNIFKGISPAGP